MVNGFRPNSKFHVEQSAEPLGRCSTWNIHCDAQATLTAMVRIEPSGRLTS